LHLKHFYHSLKNYLKFVILCWNLLKLGRTTRSEIFAREFENNLARQPHTYVFNKLRKLINKLLIGLLSEHLEQHEDFGLLLGICRDRLTGKHLLIVANYIV